MRTCHCTLPYINPNACDNCPNNQDKIDMTDEFDLIAKHELLPKKIIAIIVKGDSEE